MDRRSRAPAVGDRVDQVPRTARDVAAGPDPRVGGAQRVGVDLHTHPRRAFERRAASRKPTSAAWPTARMTVSAGITASVPGFEGRGEAPVGVEHRRHRDRLQAGDLRVADEPVRTTAVHDPDAFAFGLVDLLGIGRDLVGRFERDDRDVEHAGAACGARDVERRRHRSPRVLVGVRRRARPGAGGAAPDGRGAERGAGRVERDVAAADDDHPLAQRRRGSPGSR